MESETSQYKGEYVSSSFLIDHTDPYLVYWSGPVGPFWSENYTRLVLVRKWYAAALLFQSAALRLRLATSFVNRPYTIFVQSRDTDHTITLCQSLTCHRSLPSSLAAVSFSQPWNRSSIQLGHLSRRGRGSKNFPLGGGVGESPTTGMQNKRAASAGELQWFHDF